MAWNDSGELITCPLSYPKFPTYLSLLQLSTFHLPLAANHLKLNNHIRLSSRSNVRRITGMRSTVPSFKTNSYMYVYSPGQANQLHIILYPYGLLNQEGQFIPLKLQRIKKTNIFILNAFVYQHKLHKNNNISVRNSVTR